MAAKQFQSHSSLGIHSKETGLPRPGGQRLLWTSCIFHAWPWPGCRSLSRLKHLQKKFVFHLSSLLRDFVTSFSLMDVFSLSNRSLELCTSLHCLWNSIVILKGQEVGIKSIRCCLNNSLFTLYCDSAACQHISASFQELALWDEAWLDEDLASALTFIGTTLGRTGEGNLMTEKEISPAPPSASGTWEIWISKKLSVASGIHDESTLFNWKMWQTNHPEGYYYCLLNMLYSPDEPRKLADMCSMMYLMAQYYHDRSIKESNFTVWGKYRSYSWHFKATGFSSLDKYFQFRIFWPVSILVYLLMSILTLGPNIRACEELYITGRKSYSPITWQHQQRFV